MHPNQLALFVCGVPFFEDRRFGPVDSARTTLALSPDSYSCLPDRQRTHELGLAGYAHFGVEVPEL